MTAFSYVFTGNAANDGTGTPLRDAFRIIDNNFANIAGGNVTITVNSPVLTVANRTGNINLTVSDVAGAASYASLLSLTAAGNAYVDSQVGNISYTMGNSQNWNGSVSTVSAALDQLAARLKAAGH